MLPHALFPVCVYLPPIVLKLPNKQGTSLPNLLPTHLAPKRMPDKATLRQQMRHQLQAIPFAQRQTFSQQAAQHLAQWEAFTHARGVCLYLSTPNELDTTPIRTLCEASNKALFCPWVKAPGQMELVALSAETKLQPNRYGILEPVHPQQVPFTNVDLILVPGLAFSADFYRLGHGGGYYDRFLPQWKAAWENKGDSGKPACIKPLPSVVGVGFELQVITSLPFLAHDVKMNVILTEKGIRVE